MTGRRAPDRSGLWWRLMAAVMLMAPGSGLSAAVPWAERLDTDPPPTDFRLTLGTEPPYRFRLHYLGPTTPFRGPVCYAFAGYNETCRDPDIDWLTPATEIDLWAPGGVPRELLEGYVMLVRFPALSERRYRLALEPGGRARQTVEPRASTAPNFAPIRREEARCVHC